MTTVQTKLLEIRDLCVDFKGDTGWRNVVKHIEFSIGEGETLGIVGESGSGKSVSSLAIMGLLPPTARVSGNLSLDGRPIQPGSLVLGRDIAMIFQEPMTSLNPVQRCGAQVVEMLRQHESVDHAEARRRVIEMFEEVQLPRPEKIFDSYPHEISGGQKQRVMIAMALICHPRLLIADEPTTALDVTVQKTILDLLRSLQQKYRIGILFISHDLGVIAQIADRVAVMYHGELVEEGPAAQLLHAPRHPYTQGLLACRPPLDARPKHLPTVAEFLSQAAQASAATQQETTPPSAIAPDVISDPQPAIAQAPAAPPEPDAEPETSSAPREPLLRVRDLVVTYDLKRNLLGRPIQQLRAVDGISFDIYPGETLGLVGESGCGKSTLGRALLRLINTSSGSIEYRGQRLDTLGTEAIRQLRTKLQIIFQDPYSSLNPRLTIGEAIAEPIQVHRSGSGAAQRDRVLELMQQVGLQPDWYTRYPHQLSGGQRQRVCIARALILQPELVVCDESVSALDVSVQAQVLNLLNDLKEHYHFTYLFISHDLSVVRFLSDRILVMERGRIVEQGPADQIIDQPQQPYTQRLVSSIPRI